jgi:hypothetical protein
MLRTGTDDLVSEIASATPSAANPSSSASHPRRRRQGSFVTTFEVSIPLVKQLPLYDFKLEAVPTCFFD